VHDNEGIMQLLQLRHTATAKYELFVSSALVKETKSFLESVTTTFSDLFEKNGKPGNNTKKSIVLSNIMFRYCKSPSYRTIFEEWKL